MESGISPDGRISFEVDGVAIFSSLTDIGIEEKVDEHGYMELSGMLLTAPAGTGGEWQGRKAVLYQYMDEKRQTVFAGIIIRCHIVRVQDGYRAGLKAVSQSIDYDRMPIRRIFQDVRQSYNQVFKRAAGIGRGIRLNGRGDRLVGRPVGSSVAVNVGTGADEGALQGHLEYIFGWDRDLRLGSRVWFKGQSWHVLERALRLEGGRLERRYRIGKARDGVETAGAKDCAEAADGNRGMSGVSLMGEVIWRDGKRLKLRFPVDADEGLTCENRFGYPYVPITGNILYAMPEVGASVSLYFPNSCASPVL